MPEGLDPEGVLRGIYRFKAAREGQGAGAAVRQRSDSQRSAARAADSGEKYDVAADVWSVTSYNELRRDALAVERWNRLHPDQPRAHAVPAAGAEGRRWPDHRGQRLHEGRARPARAVAARPAGNARHRRLRPQRQPRVSAPALRDQRRIDRRRRALAAGARRQVRRRQSRSPPSPNSAWTPKRSTPPGRKQDRRPRLSPAGIESKCKSANASPPPECWSPARWP